MTVNNNTFIKISTLEDILNFPNYSNSIDNKDNKLKEILAEYTIPKEVHCGLKSCNTPHKKGFLVKTNTEIISNIGHCCGKTHFGVEFNQSANQFRKEQEEHFNRETLNTFLNSIDEKINQVSYLSNELKGDWLYLESRPLIFNRGDCPIEVVDAIQKLATNRDNTGPIKGIEYFYNENDFKKLVISDLKNSLSRLSLIKLENEDFHSTKDWARWCEEYEFKIQKAEKIINHGNRLMDKNNLELLKQFIDPNNKKSLKQLKKYIASISKQRETQ